MNKQIMTAELALALSMGSVIFLALLWKHDELRTNTNLNLKANRQWSKDVAKFLVQKHDNIALVDNNDKKE